MQYQGTAWKFGDNINTDMIIAGRYLTGNDPSVLRGYCLAGADPSWSQKVRPGDIVVAGKNFGCGSSREQAPIAIKAAGASCVIAESFGAIFYRNAINVGLPVIVFSEAGLLDQGEAITVDMAGRAIRTKNGTWTFEPPGDMVVRILEAGGLMAYIKRQT